MAVTFDLPNDIEQNLRHEFGDLGQTAKEATLVELYRQRKITQVDLSRALGISRIEAEGVLKKHHVTDDLPTDADHDAALARLRAARDK
jgi:hypothetical protein